MDEILHRIRYPSIKLIDTDHIKKIELVKNDILPRTARESVFFDIGYRMDKTIIDGIAKKYLESVPDYSDNEDDEHFLIGATSCFNSVEDISCPFLAKVWDCLNEIKINKKNVLGIYLLGLDRSEENAQKFIVLTKENMIYRWETKRVEFIDYDDVIFREDGVIDKTLIEGVDTERGQYLIRHYIEASFKKYANEVILLKCAVLQGISETHPITALTIDKKEKYIEFLINAANYQNGCTAKKILLLEYLAKEFGISNQWFNKSLKHAKDGGMKDNLLGKRLSYLIIEVVPEECIYVFYQEILSLIIDDDGNVLYDKLYHILEKNSYAGRDFCKAYHDYIVYQRKAQKSMEDVFGALTRMPIGDSILNVPELFRKQKYYNELFIQFLSIGVSMNG